MGEKELAPHALEWDRAGIFRARCSSVPGSSASSAPNHDPAWGRGWRDYWFVVAFTEELARSRNAGVNMALLVQAQIRDAGHRRARDGRAEARVLAPALAGDRIGALG
jgi:citronellyl-CoA dehydrogenase